MFLKSCFFFFKVWVRLKNHLLIFLLYLRGFRKYAFTCYLCVIAIFRFCAILGSVSFTSNLLTDVNILSTFVLAAFASGKINPTLTENIGYLKCQLAHGFDFTPSCDLDEHLDVCHEPQMRENLVSLVKKKYLNPGRNTLFSLDLNKQVIQLVL